MIPYGRQDINQSDVDAFIEVLTSDFLTQGLQISLFEGAIAQKVGADFAVAVNSATSALHIACLALGLQKGDILWTSPISFVASANCGLYCGAKINFVDIDPKTYNICPVALETKLSDAKARNELPKIIVAVHLCGQSCEMKAIHALSQKYGIKIIEDASHAIGGKYENQCIGNCSYSDITVFSGLPEVLAAADAKQNGATVFGYHVRVPERYGVVGFDNSGNVNSIIEKPKEPASNYAVTGLYFVDGTAPQLAKSVKPSARGELEITSLLESYLRDNNLVVEKMGRGLAWLDTGTHGSLLDAGNFVRTIAERQGLQVGSPDEVAYHLNYIDRNKLTENNEPYSKNGYGAYLKRISDK